MKISILDKLPDEEDEIIIKCDSLDDDLRHLIERIKNRRQKINFLKDSKIIFAELAEILYFESVDDKVFAYTSDGVFETKFRLYELEQILPSKNFFRANKAVIVNLNKISKAMNINAKTRNGINSSALFSKVVSLMMVFSILSIS